MKKQHEYSVKILSVLEQLFEEDSENFIGLEEISEGKNMTDFAHALMNLAPGLMVNKLTNSNNSALELNHMANQLCFQFANLDK